MMKVISEEIISQTISNAQQFARRRSVYRLHESDSDLVQRMLNAIEPDSYIQPHKHETPDKAEIFYAIRGKMLALLFDDLGNLVQHQEFSPNGNVCGIEFTAREWHVVWSLEPGSVALEIIEGPYAQDTHKKFASWAPNEEQKEEANKYMMEIKSKLGYT